MLIPLKRYTPSEKLHTLHTYTGERNHTWGKLYFYSLLLLRKGSKNESKEHCLFIKENQNKSSKSFLRNPSTLKLPLAHVWGGGVKKGRKWVDVLCTSPLSEGSFGLSKNPSLYEGDKGAITWISGKKKLIFDHTSWKIYFSLGREGSSN